jgi:anti-sigma regulatory factor (Ser/Thr protein kinase)
MINKIWQRQQPSITLPVNFNLSTMRRFIGEAMNLQAEKNFKSMAFDFSKLDFIEPVGVTALSNTIERFSKMGVKVYFNNHTIRNKGNKYLDDAGFFKRYLKNQVFHDSKPRTSTVPLVMFQANAYVPYLYNTLMPWISNEVQMLPDTLATIRTCLEEVFHNIQFHSGVDTGCAFAQFFPKEKKIKIAISDFGVGIPNQVRTKLPNLNDRESLKKAIEEGFTTKSNVNNRGAGLSNLIRYVTLRNSGTVLIHSGKGNLSATPAATGGAPSVTAREDDWEYPGTLVHVVLRTDTLDRLEDDVEMEVFEW